MTATPPDTADVVDEFLTAQKAMYAGGPIDAVERLMADDIVWHVPGRSLIAGDFRGRDAVLGYFRKRRDLAGGSLRITRRDRMVVADVVVELADGQARIGGRQAQWRTVGVYRVLDGQIAEAWLVPLEAAAFDEAWSDSDGDTG